MKKTFLAACCGVALIAASCSDNKATNDYTPEQQAAGDSIVETLGTFIGAQQLEQYKMAQSQLPDSLKGKYNRDEFLKGLELALTVDSENEAYIEGLNAGVNLYRAIVSSSEQIGAPLDVQKFIAAVRTAYMADSISSDSMMQIQTRFMAAQNRMEELAKKKQEDAIKTTPEYQENTAAGEKYQNERIAEGYQKAESGLIYKIENEGTGDKAKMEDRVKVAYKGTLTDGTVFDQNESAVFSPRGVVPGFAEALTMLGKGGKGTFVLPADIAYGELGQGGRGPIGPNATLTFEIEILEINPAN